MSKTELEKAAENHAENTGCCPKCMGNGFQAGAEWLARAILNTDKSLSGYNARENLEMIITDLTGITEDKK